MIRKASSVLLALTLAVGVTSCGSDDGGDDERAQTISVPTSAAPAAAKGDGGKSLTDSQLKAALLSVTDLPTGYKVDPSPSEDDDEKTESDNPECQKKFDKLDAEDNEGQVGEAEANFEGPQLGSVLQQSLESYEDDDALSKKFEEVAQVLSDCPKFTLTDKDGEKIEYSIGALSFPKLGDETLALGINIKTPQFSGAVNIAVIRLGRTVSLISQGGLSADVTALEQASRRAVAKLDAAGA